jgi:hypothetical protein
VEDFLANVDADRGQERLVVSMGAETRALNGNTTAIEGKYAAACGRRHEVMRWSEAAGMSG